MRVFVRLCEQHLEKFSKVVRIPPSYACQELECPSKANGFVIMEIIGRLDELPMDFVPVTNEVKASVEKYENF